MQPDADRSAGEAPGHDVPERARLRDRVLPGGLTLGTYFVVEAVCFGALLTWVLVAAL